MSQMDAGVRVLTEQGEPMTCRAMVEAMAKKGCCTSPGGKTPEATLYPAILRHIRKQGKEARFKKVDRGLFTLNRSRRPDWHRRHAHPRPGDSHEHTQHEKGDP